MAVNALAPCVARSSAATALTMQDKQILILCWDEFQLPVLSQHQEMIANTNVFLCFLK